MLNQVSTTFSAQGLAGKGEIEASLNLVAQKIENGTINAGVRVKEGTIALYYTVTFDVKITEYYRESLNVSVEFKMKSDGSMTEPEKVKDFEFNDENAKMWLKVGATCLVGTVLVGSALYFGIPELVVFLAGYFAKLVPA